MPSAQSSTSTTAATTFFVDQSSFCHLSFMATENHEAFITQPLTPTSMVFWYHTAETQSQFTFANSESTKCKQKLIICMYDREYSVQSTEFDIVEQGHVPTLMSLPQMRNLRFQFDLQPRARLT